MLLLAKELSLSLKQPETTFVQVTQDSQELLEVLEVQDQLEFSQVELPIQLLPQPQSRFLNLTVESTLSLILFKFQPVSNQDLPQLVLLELLDLLMSISLLSTSQLEVTQILPIILHFKSLEIKLKELQSIEIPSQLMISNLELFSTDKWMLPEL